MGKSFAKTMILIALITLIASCGQSEPIATPLPATATRIALEPTHTSLPPTATRPTVAPAPPTPTDTPNPPTETATPSPTATSAPTATTTPTATASPTTEPTPTVAPIVVKELRFQSGHFTLIGDLQVPGTDGRHPAIIMVHGDGNIDRYGWGWYRPIMERFLRAGYAVFSWDKPNTSWDEPGTGESTGEFEDPARIKIERASILVDAVEFLKKHPAIDPQRIGVWGGSQGGIVIPMALTMTDDIAFMIVASGPGMNSIDQTAYLLGQQLICQGYSEEEAQLAQQSLAGLSKATSYQEYREYKENLVQFPYALNFTGESITPEDEWSPWIPPAEAFFNPIEVIEQTTIPVLALFGEKDTQVDPFQGAQAYEQALQKAGNQHYQVELIPGVNHGFVPAKTGCMDEALPRMYAPEYLELMEEWLVQLLESMATATETITPTPDSATLQLAEEGVSTNAEWTPVVQEFDGVEMVLVPAGCFMMGSTEEEIDAAFEACKSASTKCEVEYGRGWFAGEMSRHEICFDEPFWIDRYEVTNAQFRAFGGQAAEESHWMDDDRPRETITWFEATAFCELRGVRLPTEAEWEYAARGPDGLIYPWGNDFVAANVVYEANAHGQTAEVGSRPGGASWVGALDMSGNVEEWVSSLVYPYPYDAADGREISDDFGGWSRVKRNGSWTNWDTGSDNTSFLRAAYRSGQDPPWGNYSLGFRCARAMSPQSSPTPAAVDYTPVELPDWEVSTPADQGLDPKLVADLYRNAAELPSLYGLLLVKNGHLIAEGYFNGGTLEQKALLASVAKSYTSALVGIALEQGCLSSVDQTMIEFFPEFADQIDDPRKEQITIGDMLKMRSGYPWEEFTPPYLDTLGTKDNWLPFIVEFPLTSDPGTEFGYSNLTAHLLGVIVARACDTSLLSYGQQVLFSPMNARVGAWPYDANGYYYGSSDISFTARDAAKFGLLYLNHGEYAGNQVVSADWVRDSLQTYSENLYNNRLGRYFTNIGYGYLWWSARAGDHHFNYAWGHGGNLIVLLDELDMVIVTTANPLHGVFGEEAWEKEGAIIDLVGRFIQSIPKE
jgi:formylglycine-generating enzyme required for sulfatase activity/CubicO group peptidase (beta-lactamase class C family)/acetyl esterase/lipase